MNPGAALPPYGYSALARAREAGAAWVLGEIDRAGLRGRGGAAFPTARKWSAAVETAQSPTYVLANGEEGEPCSWKDRYLLRHHPHLVIEGAAIAATAIGAQELWIYVADGPGERALAAAAVTAAGELEGLTVHVVNVEHTYVAGEETAAVRYINEGVAKPTMKPPRPVDSGIRGAPTVVDNVETLAHAAWIIAHGADAYRSVGTPESSGTFLACVSGAVGAPALMEVPFGTSLRTILDHAGVCEPLWGVLIGGYFSGFLPAKLLETPADFDTFRSLGFGLGNGNIVAVSRSKCPVAVIRDVHGFFAAESSGQCGPCVRGTAELRDIFERLGAGTAVPDDIERLQRLGNGLRGRGACQLLDAAAINVLRVLEHFGDIITEHLRGPCQTCAEAGPIDPTGGYSVSDGDAGIALSS
jgi:NADH:ubiquinone oxidoreductase subunit F (NADH-binding)